MRISQNIAVVIIGYLIFAVSAVLLFQLGGIDPHVETGITTVSMIVLFGAIFSFVGGFAANAIAAARSLVVNIVLAVLVFGFAAFSSIQSPGSHYTQFAAMAVFAPVSLLGGYVSKRTLSPS